MHRPHLPHIARLTVAAVVLATLRLLAQDAGSVLSLGRAETIAPGIDLFHLGDSSLLSPPGPVAVQLLRLDPRRVVLRSALAMDRVIGLETVASTAARHHAIAAVNGGFFLPSGDPAGLIKIGGELV